MEVQEPQSIQSQEEVIEDKKLNLGPVSIEIVVPEEAEKEDAKGTPSQEPNACACQKQQESSQEEEKEVVQSKSKKSKRSVATKTEVNQASTDWNYYRLFNLWRQTSIMLYLQ